YKPDNHTGKNTVKNKVAETCGTKGYTGDTVCECGVTVAEGKEIPATGKHTGGKATCKVKAVCTACKQSYGSLRSHSYSTVVTTKATLKKNGKTAVKCTVCGNVKSTATVYKVKSVKLSTTVYAYSGKNKTPSVTVKDSKGNVLKKGTDYTVSYPKKRKSVGKYTVTVTFKGKYSGTKKLTFEIVPAKANLSKVTAGSKQLTASWSKVKGASGYEVQYSTSKKFTKKTTKAVIRSSKSKKTTIKSLKKGKTYYVRVRAYKTVGKVKVYGAWSTVKSVKVK
ncbi:MAG: fibronectin type III domain-containing protein, partial [Clostridia bacterium]|nr:fibronectin type III domain-containing protein [Clostridia bacterium]